MMPVFQSSIFSNRIPQAQSAAEGGRSSGGFFFGFDPKATAYKAREGTRYLGIPPIVL
jgi:hypothetical protein